MDKGKSTVVSTRKVTKTYGIDAQVLRHWVDKGIITPVYTRNTGRWFKLEDIQALLDHTSDKTKKQRVLYCRVSSQKQHDDLQRQVAYLRSLYPLDPIVTDIGSGINFKRKGLCSLLEQAVRGELEEVVVSHKDCLARFGIELIDYVFKIHGVKLTILSSENSTEERELADDLLAIVHVFNCRQRRYRVKKQVNPATSDSTTKKDSN